jgi:HAE1 family hydrophobic/amphiphilic exporter-1
MQKLAEICVRRPVFATMLILSLTVVGLFSYKSLGVDLFPKIDLPTITVTVVNPGASPQEIETEITDQVEGAVNTISVSMSFAHLGRRRFTGLHHVPAREESRRRGAGSQKQDRADHQRSAGHGGTADRAEARHRRGACSPHRVSAPRSLREVTDVADNKIKQQIESINGVGDVQIIGGRRREIEIWVDPDKMRAFNVTVRASRRCSARARTWKCPADVLTKARAS